MVTCYYLSMKLSKEGKKLLGLSKEEVRVLSVINDKPKRTSDIYHLLDQVTPRTTLIRLLYSLYKRGFLAKHKYSPRRGGWIITPLNQLKDILSGTFEEKSEVKVFHDIHQVIIYRGKNEMLKLADKVLLFRQKERIFWMQPDYKWEAWRIAGFKDRAHWLNTFFQEREIIVDLVVCDNFLEKDLFHANQDLLFPH